MEKIIPARLFSRRNPKSFLPPRLFLDHQGGIVVEPNQGLTQLLIRWGNGDRAALHELMPLVYDDLRRYAHSFLRRRSRHQTLQPTALVHEAYLRLAGR